MRLQRTLLAIGALLIGMTLGYWFRGWLDVDRCLDRGGRWNYEAGWCERTTER